MLIILSPAKTIDFDKQIAAGQFSIPEHLNKTKQLIALLKKKNTRQLGLLMKISPKLAQLNYERFQEWHTPFIPENAKPSVFVFKGEVYVGLNVDEFSNDDLAYMQNHLRILSGLHGVLRPLDLIQPYRLEMGTKLQVGPHKDLYGFWRQSNTSALNKVLNGNNEDILVNLASDEYFRSIDQSKLNARIITPVFKDYKNGSYKFLSFYGKKARGMMAGFILKNRLKKTDDIKFFEEDGYFYNENLSKDDQFVFTRG